jgi:hypothetical protein
MLLQGYFFRYHFHTWLNLLKLDFSRRLVNERTLSCYIIYQGFLIPLLFFERLICDLNYTLTQIGFSSLLGDSRYR